MKNELNVLFRAKAEFLIQKAGEHHYFNGSRPSYQLALQLRSNERQACISAIQSSGGNIVTTATEINTVFSCFYKELYRSDFILSKDKYNTFFTELNMKKLFDTEAADLGANISNFISNIFIKRAMGYCTRN